MSEDCSDHRLSSLPLSQLLESLRQAERHAGAGCESGLLIELAIAERLDRLLRGDLRLPADHGSEGDLRELISSLEEMQSLVFLTRVAHEAGDERMERAGQNLLSEQYGMRLAFDEPRPDRPAP